MSYPARIVAVFCLGWAIIYADRTALFPLLPVIGGEMGLSAVQAGAIASAYFLAYVVVQPFVGVIGDRLGLKRVLVAMVLVAGPKAVPLVVRNADGSRRFYDRLFSLLQANPEAYAANLEKHFARHLQPFV